MLIGRDKIREIVERTDLVQLIGRHVQLKRAGRSFKGLCPFHGERTPSFYVTPERHSYKCFGCQKGGDAIRFVMEYEGKDFLAAVRGLAQDAGVPIAFDPEEERRVAQRRQLLHACQVASRWFEEELWGARGGAGRAHLQVRGVSEHTARASGLGYAPPGFTGLRDRLLREGVSVENAVAAGLLALRDRPAEREADRAYDVFRGRLMIPIRDPDGRVIAFGGRVVEGDDERKYLNSRETPLYVKSRVLYGLDLAREPIRRARSAVLVEGYFDAIALWEAGIPNVVALCSTVLTPEHLRLLERLDVSDLVLLLDGDDAGRKAAVRLAGPILASGLAARVVELPEGQDPDDFVKARGKEGYLALAESAPPLSTYVVEGALGDASGSYEDKLRALGALRPVVAALPEDAARALFL
ncbi:MAG TPA: DNA primase, partial [Vulgatibacter sp.]